MFPHHTQKLQEVRKIIHTDDKKKEIPELFALGISKVLLEKFKVEDFSYFLVAEIELARLG